MILKLSPQRSDEAVAYTLKDDILTIITSDGLMNQIDLSGDWVKLEPDNDGEQLEPTGKLLAGVRENGVITLTVVSHHGPDAPTSETFPEPIELLDGESVTFPRGRLIRD